MFLANFMSPISKKILTLIAIAFISGCGQTGKLYLPEQEAAALGNTQTEAGPIQATTESPNKDDLEAELKSQGTAAGN